MLLIYVLLFLLFFYNSSFLKTGIYKEDVLNVNESTSIKGVMAILIVLVHLSQRVSSKLLFIFPHIAHLILGIFLFYSGYGLTKNFVEKEDYLNNFLSRRLFKILIPFFISNILFLLLYSIVYNRDFTIVQIIKYLLGIELIDGFKWYVLATIFLYCSFYICFKYLKGDNTIFGLSLMVALYCLLCKSLNLGVWWYNSIFCFIVGVIMGKFKNRIFDMIKLKYIPTLIIIFILFVFSFGINIIVRGTAITSSISAVIFVTLFTVILLKIRVGNEWSMFLGKISYEIYLIHRLPLEYFEGKFNNEFIYIVTCIGITIISAYILKKVIYAIDRGILKRYSYIKI